MEVFKIVCISLFVIYLIAIIVLAMREKRPVVTLLVFAGIGIGLLLVINLTSKFTGVYLPINSYTVGASAAGGAAGIIALLLLRVIFEV
jgi:hypothetical protein